MIKSRQMTNAFYPEGYTDENIDEEYVNNIATYSPKISIFLESLETHPGKHVLFSEFKTSHGVNLVAAILKIKEIPYLMFTGDLNDANRMDVVARWNNVENNLRGETYRILLITSAAALGQNFLQTRVLTILEENISELLIRQVMGRVNRYKSHEALPIEERNILIQRFFATTEEISSIEDMATLGTSDWLAYQIGMKRMEKINVIINILDSLKVVPPPMIE
jgi:hypothetical protein